MTLPPQPAVAYRKHSSVQKRATKVGRWRIEADELMYWNRHMFWLFDVDWRAGPVDMETSFFARVHPDDVPSVREAKKAAEQSTGGYHTSYRCVWRDGTELKVKVFASRMIMADGSIAMTGTCVNMTELQGLHDKDVAQMQHEQIQHCTLRSKQQKQHAIAVVGEAGSGVQPGSWSLGRCIAVGSYGAVHVAVHEATSHTFAVKIIPVKTYSLDQLELQKYLKACDEVYILRQLRHPNIVAYYGAEVHGNQLCILQEFVPGGSLGLMLQKTGALSQELTRHYAHQILQGLAYLHT
jgi:Protein kinase domain